MKTSSPEKARQGKVSAKTVEKYAKAVELYGSTQLSCREICRICGVTPSGLGAHINRYHRHLLLKRNGIECEDAQAARHIKLGSLRGQSPATRAKYREAIEACGRMEHIEMNLSELARLFGLDGSGLARQLRTHYPEILEQREKERLSLGHDDHLPRGSRHFSKKQYAKAVEMLRADRYITVREAADRCGVSYSGLEQHLLFYHKDLVNKRIRIREKAVRQKCKGEITGRGSVHAPAPKIVEKYAPALRLYRTTCLSAARIAKLTNVPKKGFCEYLQKWHKDLVCKRRNIPYEEGKPVDWSKARKYNPATRQKYAQAIRKLKESELPTATVAIEYGLHPECLRRYIREHEPELHARQGMVKGKDGQVMARRSMQKYAQAVRIYETTTESLKSIAQRLSLVYPSLCCFVRRNFPQAGTRHKALCAAGKEARTKTGGRASGKV